MTPTPAVPAKEKALRDRLADLIDEVAEVRGEHPSDHAVLQNADEIADAVLKLLPAALSTEGEAEPVAWRYRSDGKAIWNYCEGSYPRGVGAEIVQPLYASPPSAGVKVKPLEWQACQNDIHHANPDWLFCGYVIARTGERVTWRPSESDEWRESASLDEAKAAAQADYEARIRASLATEKEG